MSSRKTKEKIQAWLKIMRLQFYPMAFIAYSLGASVVLVTSRKINLGIFGLGYAVLFLVELATILTNEYYDYQSDCLNKNFSPFNGGSRVLVDGALSFKELKIGLIVVAGLMLVLSGLLLWVSPGHSTRLTGLLIVAGMILGLGYTAPPLQFSYRGLGELDVGLTHSFYLVLCGYAFQTGTMGNPLPWLVSIPLFFSILAANTMAGIPDYQADLAASKRSFPVILGPRRATQLAAGFFFMAALSGIFFWYYRIIGAASNSLILIVAPHGLILIMALFQLIRSNQYNRRINGLMALSLSYIIWFGLIPLISLVRSP
jgi:1,4-dihydroxy-2-naphthoate polyprenyltransferase